MRCGAISENSPQFAISTDFHNLQTRDYDPPFYFTGPDVKIDEKESTRPINLNYPLPFGHDSHHNRWSQKTLTVILADRGYREATEVRAVFPLSLRNHESGCRSCVS